MLAVCYTADVLKLQKVWGTKESLHTHWSLKLAQVSKQATLSLTGLQEGRYGQVLEKETMECHRSVKNVGFTK